MSGHTIDISGWTCPCCPHTNGDHRADGQCSQCVCWRKLKLTLTGSSRSKR